MSKIYSEGARRYWQDNVQWFDNLYRKASWFDRTFRKDIYRRMAVAMQVCSESKEPTVLDIGCGSGHVVLGLLIQAGASHVTGIDFSRPMLQMAKKLFHEQGLSDRATWIEGDVLDHDFGDARFDLVIALGVFDYIREASRLWELMISLASHAVVASFPAPVFLRSNLRRLRYSLRGCPVYFYSREDLDRLIQHGGRGHVDYIRVQTGHVLVAKFS